MMAIASEVPKTLLIPQFTWHKLRSLLTLFQLYIGSYECTSVLQVPFDLYCRSLSAMRGVTNHIRGVDGKRSTLHH